MASQQTESWVHLAEMNAATNELAALYYNRLFRAATLAVSVLTVIVGAKGLSTLATGTTNVVDVITSIMQILLGVFATVLANMELKNKGISFAKRASAYKALASSLRVELVLQPEERTPKLQLLTGIPNRVTALEELAEPLPLRYRLEAERLQSVTRGLWTLGVTRRPATGRVPEPVYDPARDVEGNPNDFAAIIGQML